MSTPHTLSLAVPAFTLLALCAHSAHTLAINFYGAAHFTSAQSYDSLTDTRTSLGFDSPTQITGAWHSVQSSGSEIYAEHHSYTGQDMINVDMFTNRYRTYHGAGTDAPYTDRFGTTLFYLEFEITSTLTDVSFLSRGANIQLTKVHPDQFRIMLTSSTSVRDLTPGFYSFDANVEVPGESQHGTLFLPSPSALSLLAPLCICVTRRRRR